MKVFLEKLKSLDAGVIIRTIMLTLTYINQIIAVVGMNTFANSTLYQIITLVCTIIISAVAAWKNNNFTHLAQLSGKVLTALKDKTIDEQEIQDLLDKANSNKTDVENVLDENK